MRKIGLSASLIFFSFLNFSWSVEKSFEIQPCKGFVSNYDAVPLKDSFCADAQNVTFDNDLGAKKRDAFDRFNTTSLGSQTVSVLGQFVTTDGDEYLMAVSSNIFGYSIGSSSITTIISTVSPNTPMDCVSAMNRFVCTSSTQAFYWKGGPKTVDVTTSPTGFPLGDFIAKHVNRIWVAGVKGNTSILYGSAFLDADNWVLGGNSGDPVSFTIGINDGDVITGIYSFGDALVIFKRRSMWVLLGKNQNNFEIKNISNQIGCVQHRSIREKQGKLYWLSHRGIEKLEAGVISQSGPFSDPIKDVVDNVVSGFGSSSVKSSIDTSQSDFDAGKSTYADTESQSGSVSILRPSTKTIDSWPGTYNTDGDISANSNQTTAQSFRSIVNANVLRVNVPLCAVNNPPAILYATIETTDATFSTKPSGVVLSTVTKQGSDIVGSQTCGTPVAPFYQSLASFNFSQVHIPANTTYWFVLRSTAQSNPGGGGGTFKFYSSTRTDPYPQGFRYTKRGPDGSEPGVETLSVTDLNFQIYLSTGIFESRVIDLGSNLKIAALFSANFSENDGKIRFYARGAASEESLKETSWSPQAVGSTPSVNNSRYIQWKADFDILFATQSPSIQDVTIEWVTLNSGARQNVVSWIFDDQYWLSCSTNTHQDSTNNTVIVVDRFDNFSKMNGINALSYAEAFGRRYFGTSVSSGGESGLVNRFSDNSFSDNGKSIDAFVITKDFCGENCEATKSFTRIYVKTKNDGASGGTLTGQYQFNRDGTFTSLGDVSLTEGAGFVTSKVLFTYGSGGSQARQVRFKFGNNQAGHDFRFYGAKVFYDEFPIE